MIPKPRVVFILNGKSGSCDAAEVSEAAKRAAEKNEFLADIQILDADSDLDALVKGALETGAQIVADGGGDGTISAIAAALVASEVPLSVLPPGAHLSRISSGMVS